MASSLAMNGFRKKTHIWLGNRGRRGRIVLNTFTLVLSCSPPFTTQYLFGGDLRRNKVYYTTTSSQRLATSFLEDFTALGDLCPRKHHGKMRKMPNFRGCKLIKGNIKAQVLCYTRPTSKYMVKLLSAAALKWVTFPPPVSFNTHWLWALWAHFWCAWNNSCEADKAEIQSKIERGCMSSRSIACMLAWVICMHVDSISSRTRAVFGGNSRKR